MRAVCCVCVSAGVSNRSIFALEPEAGSVFIRIIDTGAAESCIIKTDNERYIVYDAGHWAGNGYRAFEGVHEIVPTNRRINLMVLSHTDGDHIGAVGSICDAYRVDEVLRSSLRRETATWGSANTAIRREVRTSGCRDVALAEGEEAYGTTAYGHTDITFVSGFHSPPADWGISQFQHEPEWNNAGSICMRLDFAGRSVLFCGDAVGRYNGDPPNVCIGTEKYMCDHANEVPVRSDILIAPHHGSDNASSERFIAAVDPTWVVFSAGHGHRHPKTSTANRYLAHGVRADHMLRTDRRDDESEQEEGNENWQREWNYGRQSGYSDPPGDDDVDILIRPNGTLLVEYRHSDEEQPDGDFRPFALERTMEKQKRVKKAVPQWVLDEEKLTEEEFEQLHRQKATVTPSSLTRACCKPICRCYWRRFRCR